MLYHATFRNNEKIRRGIQLVIVLVFLSTLFQMSQLQARAETQPWMDTSLPAEQRAKLLLAAMTLDEKIAMIHGGSAGSGGYVGHVPSIPRLNIPALNLHDGPAGVAAGALSVTAFPAPITVAASWDPALMEQYGIAMAEEERGKGVNIQLAPMMNIDRVPRAGRNFEGYGEDPYLSAQMAAAAVRGIQSTGLIAVAKHFIGNEQEYQRMAFSSEMDIRTQHEIYLPPFKAAVDAGVGAIMCSYNLVNGVYACENSDTQNTMLKGELGFTGWIMSDWGATHSTIASALGGLDMEMPGGPNYVQLKAAIEAGKVPLSRLDDMVLRILTPIFRAGLFDHAPTGTYGTAVQTDAHKKFARDAAAQGLVLLKNDGAILPLDATKIHSIAVFGTAADENPIVVGGGSGRVSPTYNISPLQGITDRAGSAIAVQYFTAGNAAGHAMPASFFQTAKGAAAGLKAQYFNNPDLTGSPTLTKVDANVDFDWQGAAPATGIKSSAWSARWSGIFTPATSGRYNLTLTGTGKSRLYIDDKLVIDNWDKQPAQPKVIHRRLTAGQTDDVRVEYAPLGAADSLHLTWFTPDDDPNEAAAAIAAQVDASILVVGTSSSEGSDRQNLDLSDQPLITAISKANPHTIVVVYNPSQTLLPWADGTSAILVGWLPGQEAGNALADVLFGDVNPAGKLPVTYARSESDYPANTDEMYPGLNGRVLYTEGLQVGYRHFDAQQIAPLYPFGHGLSYTTFEYGKLNISPATTTDGNITVTFTLKNTGQRAGAEVAQLYIGFPSEASEPPRQLKGFQKISLKPGESKPVTFTLSPDAFSFWSAGLGKWATYPGAYQILVGSSSRDIRQSGTFDMQGGPLAGTITQAETASLTGDAAVAKNQTGYLGTGFVGGFQKQGASASFKVNAPDARKYTLTLRYASTLRPGEQNTPRTLSLYINQKKIGQTSLPNLANWNMWDFKTEIVTLNAGENTITYQYDAGDNADVHLDAIILAKIVEPGAAPSSTAQTPVKTPPPGANIWLPIFLFVLVLLVVIMVLLRWRSITARKQ